MVIKMTKYSFVMLSGQTDAFLSQLQNLGVMDISRSSKPIDEKSSDLLERINDYHKTIAVLKKLDYSNGADYEAITKAYQAAETVQGDVVAYVRTQLGRLENLKARIAATRAEIKSREIWGEFDSEAVSGLSSIGCELHYYSVPLKKYESSWESEFPICEINRDKTNVYFVIVGAAAKDFPGNESAAPKASVAEAKAELAAIEEENVVVKAALLRAKDCVESMNLDAEKLSAEFELYLAGQASEKAAEDSISILTGFAPTEMDESLKTKLDELGVYYLSEPAKEEDNPPIKLKNNWFARQFELLTGMYGMPSYGEFDPTPVLAPFFLLFFSMCMGDAAYGLALIAIALVLKYKMGASSLGKMAPLVMCLGIGTTVVGFIFGTFLGYSIAEMSFVPEWMKKCIISGKVPGTTYDKTMALAVGIGIFHLCLAMIIKAYGYSRRFGLKSEISSWSWLLLILGGIAVAALAFTGVINAEITKWAIIIIGAVSALGIYVFNTPGRNPLINIGAGLWDTYNMVTGLLGDVLSYIRLYALGLAGGMLGAAFNDLGKMLFDAVPVPGLNWIALILILVLGHVLNLAMSCLGAFVHPLRLTFVEYFKNSGYEGTGTKYKPLTNENKQ